MTGALPTVNENRWAVPVTPQPQSFGTPMIWRWIISAISASL